MRRMLKSAPFRPLGRPERLSVEDLGLRLVWGLLAAFALATGILAAAVAEAQGTCSGATIEGNRTVYYGHRGTYSLRLDAGTPVTTVWAVTGGGQIVNNTPVGTQVMAPQSGSQLTLTAMVTCAGNSIDATPFLISISSVPPTNTPGPTPTRPLVAPGKQAGEVVEQTGGAGLWVLIAAPLGAVLVWGFAKSLPLAVIAAAVIAIGAIVVSDASNLYLVPVIALGIAGAVVWARQFRR